MAVIGEVAMITSDFQGVRITLNQEYQSEELIKYLNNYKKTLLLKSYTKFFKTHQKKIQKLLKK